MKIHKILLKSLAVASSLVMLTSASAEEVTLRVANYGGVFTAAQAKYAGDIFTQRTGVKISWVDANPKDHFAKMMANRGRTAPFDVVYLDDNVQADAIAAGLVDKLDENVVTNLSKLYPQARNAQGFGPAILYLSVGLAYNKDAFAKANVPAPQSWLDLWNPALQGHVAIPDVSTIAGQDFVIAVARAMGGDESNVDAAMKKIGELRAKLIYKSSSVLRAQLQGEDIWVAPWYNGRAWGMTDEGSPIVFTLPKEKGILGATTIDMVKGTKHPKEAQMFINQTLDPLAQLGQAYEVPYGPTNEVLGPILQAYPDVSKKFPASRADLEQLYAPDWDKVNTQYQKWVEDWNRVVIGH